MTQADSVHSTPPTNTSVDTTLDRPADSAGALYYPTPVTPEEAFQAIGRLRKAARAEIERLIDWLDSTDNHMEREPDGDEADASYPESGAKVDHPMEDDENSDTDEDSDPPEASLGFLERHPSLYGAGRDQSGNQENLCAGLRGDLEDEHDGAEPPEDDEPSLGWTTTGVMGGLNDRELDSCDRESIEPLLTECT